MRLRTIIGIEDPTKALRRNQGLFAMIEGEVKTSFAGETARVVYHSAGDPLFNGGKQLYSYVHVGDPAVLREVKAHPGLVGYIDHSPRQHAEPVPTVHMDDVVEGHGELTKVLYFGPYGEFAPSCIKEFLGNDCLIYAIVTPADSGYHRMPVERVSWADHWYPVPDSPSVKFDLPEFDTMAFDVMVVDHGGLDARSRKGNSHYDFRSETYIDEMYRLVKPGGLVKYIHGPDGIKNGASKFCARFERPMPFSDGDYGRWTLCGIRKERISYCSKAVSGVLDRISPQKGLEVAVEDVFTWTYPLPGEDKVESKVYEDSTVPMHAIIHKHGEMTMEDAEAILAPLVDKLTKKKDQFEVSLKMGGYAALADIAKEHGWGTDPDFRCEVHVKPPAGFDVFSNEAGFVSLGRLSEFGKASVPCGSGHRNGYIVEIENAPATLPALRAYADEKGWEVVAKGQKPTVTVTCIPFTWSPTPSQAASMSVHVKNMNDSFAEKIYDCVDPQLAEGQKKGSGRADKKSGKRSTHEKVVPVEPSLVNATKLLSDLPPQILVGGENGDGAVILATGRVDKEEILSSIPDEEYGVIESVLTKPVSKFVVYPLDQPSADVLDCKVGDWIIASDL
ncbi:hypothetical protein FY034_17205 (plasmid) [Trichlorobacter lovleyi]|uniref:hypothetical protein n=1 Tax=Trichlorobacter lovleyi TaxID=313985 RepID=UPI0022409862|nr:hypothetical protein [Trichlorobacter lovleyi]QOX80761.1 hypothetical protein FY034_17205 [Trichlorobacter lovleyi]